MADGSASAATDQVAHMARQWQHVIPELDVEPLLIMGRMQRIVAISDPLLRSTFAASGLGAGDFDVLAALRRHDADGPVSPGELAEAMLVTPGAATKRIDRLVEAGLVIRRRAGTDGRGRSISLTDAGRQLTDRLMPEHMAGEAALLTALDPDDRAQLAGLLARMLTALEGTHTRHDTGE